MASAPAGNIRFWLKGYLFIGVAVLFLAMLIYSNHLIARMRENSEATSRLFSRYLENVIFEVADDGSLANLRAVLQESDLPIIITIFEGRPILWSGVPVDERTEEDFEMLANMDVDNPPTPKLRRLVDLYREYDKQNAPIPIQVAGAGDVPTGWVHYGPSPLQRELRYMPFVLLGIFLVFMAVAIQGLRYLKLSEQRSIWVGLAKETAHQLGTPLSAMLGWVQVIRDRASEKGYDDIRGYVDEMEVDLGRLNKVTERFSKIGAAPERANILIESPLARTVAYFEKRLPSLRANSGITLTCEPGLRVLGNEELLEWVFENLIKNAVDALGEAGGTIAINARRDGSNVEVLVQDSGRGIPGALKDQIFRPGFSTKRRGWGLGLALTRRIVEEYHAGSIKLVESRAGKGTTFSVRLPAA
ncbi:MAG: HAMP domain-containing histidine kinase [Candidatus Krumholzibacteria bacterium]|nr:HAMP domain-containing histidine kinase [Candidatus Krumholzibacteria bacterium]MDH4336955.1 HAMP domain-containing histidine kinase [Candidatus Krumholzibacteria bacterium]MDH5269749.1 HAMP domain-containing histidine kinase [Candidatus Krumholzibacteria bacterium]MDH5627338.1 HAMP domain-containing histidine kinase [Candidatus Krumholzibacteria bacterium]